VFGKTSCLVDRGAGVFPLTNVLRRFCLFGFSGEQSAGQGLFQKGKLVLLLRLRTYRLYDRQIISTVDLRSRGRFLRNRFKFEGLEESLNNEN
jgi:hypothetical protein